MTEGIPLNVGESLQRLRGERGLSMRALAKASGLSANALSMIERGRTSPSVGTLYKLADALGVPVTAFFGTPEVRQQVIHLGAHERARVPVVGGTWEGLGGEKFTGRVEPFVLNLEPAGDWAKIDADRQSAMAGEAAIFGEISPLFEPITKWTENELNATTEAVQLTRDRTKKVSAWVAGGVTGFLLLVGFLLGRSIIGPVRAITGVLEKVAAGQQNISIPSQDQKDEIGQMARILASFHKDSAQATRTQSALEVASSPFMLVNNDGSIIALNKSAQDMFNGAEVDLQEVEPEFSANAIAGGNLAMFGETLVG